MLGVTALVPLVSTVGSRGCAPGDLATSLRAGNCGGCLVASGGYPGGGRGNRAVPLLRASILLATTSKNWTGTHSKAERVEVNDGSSRAASSEKVEGSTGPCSKAFSSSRGGGSDHSADADVVLVVASTWGSESWDACSQ